MSGTLKKKTSLRVVWSTEMENMLLDLWEEKIYELRGSRKNSHVYQEMAVSMQEVGFCGSWTDIRTKMDNLTRKYRVEKSKIGPTGGTPSNWEHYYKVHNILGSFKLNNIESSMHESTDMSSLLNESEVYIEFDPDASCSSHCQSDFEFRQGPPPKKRKMDVNAELVTLAKQRIDMLKQHQEERKHQISEMVKRLDTISSQNANFQTELLEILRQKKIKKTKTTF